MISQYCCLSSRNSTRIDVQFFIVTILKIDQLGSSEDEYGILYGILFKFQRGLIFYGETEP